MLHTPSKGRSYLRVSLWVISNDNFTNICWTCTVDTQEEKEGTKERQIRNIAELKTQLEEQQKRTQHQRELNLAAQEALEKVVNGIDELFRYGV